MLPENSRCVKSHTSCSWAHADMVRTYVEERHRQEMIRDETRDYDGGSLITFKEWLIGSRR